MYGGINMGIKNIIQENHYPIVFIGSGIEKRYLKDFPNWTSLLETFWNQIGEKRNFFGFIHQLTKKYKDENAITQDFLANVEAASYIQQKFDDLFFEEKIFVKDLTLKNAQESRISPFKKEISNLLSNYELRDDINEGEFQFFVQMIEKAKMIITTNYDTFIEDLIRKNSNQNPHVFVGKNSLFDSNNGWSEIYHIHGSVNDPTSIVINSDDYADFNKNSILISAKIMSSMIDSPIIFFGYSMTDRNVRQVLDDFGSQLPQEDPRKSANRILVVEYEKNENKITEQIVKDSSLNHLNYILIKTDNYKDIFKQLSTINEGATPYEVRKFSGLIRKIIVQHGQSGNLNSVLVTPTQLDTLSKDIDQGKPIVVALGDKKYFYVYPDTISYIKDYIANTTNYAPGIALSFVARSGNQSTKIPFAKYWNNTDKLSLNISHKDLMRLNKKIESYGTIDKAKKSISKLYRIPFSSINEIKQQKYPIGREIDTIAWNIENISNEEIEEYLKEILPDLYKTLVIKSTGFTSCTRRLLVIRDLYENGDMIPYNSTKKSQ